MVEESADKEEERAKDATVFCLEHGAYAGVSEQTAEDMSDVKRVKSDVEASGRIKL